MRWHASLCGCFCLVWKRVGCSVHIWRGRLFAWVSFKGNRLALTPFFQLYAVDLYLYCCFFFCFLLNTEPPVPPCPVVTQLKRSVSSVGGDVKFVSLNSKGLNNPIKRSRVLHYLRHLDAHIIYLQETHLRAIDSVRLKKSWVREIYHSSFSSKSRGVAIL